MAPAKFSWSFPANRVLFLRLEKVVIAIVALLILLFSISSLRILPAIVYAILFVVVYFLVALGIRHVRQVEEKYHISGTHLHIHRKSRNKESKAKIPLKQVVLHKLDRLFLGGYVLTSKGERHPLFFNVKEEMEKFEKLILRRKKLKK